MKTILDVIENGKWHQALFTTYALSLSFFDSILLRALRQGGCQEIWVISDLQGYKASLVERRSHAVGHDYRLIPVRLGNGVFHPKCMYLAGTDEDALSIGSGNLTFGGFGRNLEALEVFSSKESPDIFNDFASLLADLRSRTDFESPDLTWCATFEDRARSAGVLGDGSRGPRLIHSATTPILEQLTTLLSGVEEMTVLSPFFDNDGYAIRKTAEQLGCGAVRIAVPPKSSVFNFPFEKALSWDTPIAPVWSKSIDPKRPIHAKWFEFRGSMFNSVMTGSTNATRQALCTTNNIEVSVLRIAPSNEEWANWSESQLPNSFSPAIYLATGTKDLLAHATLTNDVLEGMILGLSITVGWWDGVLMKPNGETKHFKVHLNEQARFQLADLSFAEFAISSGVQIVLSSGTQSARGWVQSEDVLRMTGLQHLSRGSLLRFIARENTEDDDIALLEYFAVHAHKHLINFSGKIKSLREHKEAEGNSSVITVELEELAPTEAPSAFGNAGTDMAESSLKRIFAQFRRRLLGSGPKRDMQFNHQVHSEVESDSGDPDDSPDAENTNEEDWEHPPDRIQNALKDFDMEMRSLVASPNLSPADCRGVLVLWFEVTTCMLRMRKRDVAGTYAFLSQWVNMTARATKASSVADSLEQHFVTSIAVLSAKNSEDCVELHELVESFYGTAVEMKRLTEALLPVAGIPFGELGIAQDCSLKDALARVLESTTLRQELLGIIAATKTGGAINVESRLFKGTTGQHILMHLQSISGNDRFKEQLGDQPACAKCFMRLPDAMAMSLKYSRIASHCGWITVRTKI